MAEEAGDNPEKESMNNPNESRPNPTGESVTKIADRIVKKVCGNWLLTEADIENLKVAIATEVADDRGKRPHLFVGRFDRGCELCGMPDRDSHHVFTGDRIVKAIEFERRVCLEIIMKIANQYLPNPAVVQSHADAAAFSACQEIAAEFAVRGRMYDGAGDFRELIQKARQQCAEIADEERRVCKEQAAAHEADNMTAALALLGGEIAARNVGESIRAIED